MCTSPSAKGWLPVPHTQVGERTGRHGSEALAGSNVPTPSAHAHPCRTLLDRALRTARPANTRWVRRPAADVVATSSPIGSGRPEECVVHAGAVTITPMGVGDTAGYHPVSRDLEVSTRSPLAVDRQACRGPEVTQRRWRGHGVDARAMTGGCTGTGIHPGVTPPAARRRSQRLPRRPFSGPCQEGGPRPSHRRPARTGELSADWMHRPN